jgi:hypothetical protein
MDATVYASLIQPTSQAVVDVAALNKLKEKVICEFKTLLKKIGQGYKPDYEFILEEISFIDLI